MKHGFDNDNSTVKYSATYGIYSECVFCARIVINVDVILLHLDYH